MDKKNKVVEAFPVARRIGIRREYFQIFCAEFSQRVMERVPTAASVSFPVEEATAVALFTGPAAGRLLSLWRRLAKDEGFYGIEEGELLFTLSDGDNSFIVCVSGADPLFLQRLDEGWLREVCQHLIRDFRLICSGFIDCATGLPNLPCLQNLLDEWQQETGGYLALVELPCRYGAASRKHRYMQFCSRVLKNFVQNSLCVHYLGQEIFALIFPVAGDSDHEFADVANRLIAFLKKEGCFRVHIGSTLWLPGHSKESEEGRNLLDQAWSALQYAEKRGPFSFCSYQHLAYPEQGKLVPPANSLQQRLRKLWRNVSRFSLLLLRADSQGALPSVIEAELEQEPHLVCDGDHHYLLFPGDDGREARQRAEQLIAFGKAEKAESFSGGIALFPYADFKRSEMAMNCKKALVHASFLGPASVAVFDPTSLNISGDIYFAEGDFTKAIFEYRRGLFCSGGEVNLYNSLGVTLALMNRLKPALESFSAALGLDAQNFMALYNSGLALRDLGQPQQAFTMLERAYANGGTERDNAAAMRDIELYLGMLGVESEQMEAAVHYLSCWLAHCGQKKESGKVYRYLGLAYNGVGNVRKAVEFLQKALHYDQSDAQSLSLLGYLYLKTGEGRKIARTLCRKSVELEPDNLAFLLYFAECLIACEEYDEGRLLLQRCQRNDALRDQAWLLLGELHLLQGKVRIAGKYFRKLSGRRGLAADIRRRVHRGMKNCE